MLKKDKGIPQNIKIFSNNEHLLPATFDTAERAEKIKRMKQIKIIFLVYLKFLNNDEFIPILFQIKLFQEKHFLP